MKPVLRLAAAIVSLLAGCAKQHEPEPETAGLVLQVERIPATTTQELHGSKWITRDDDGVTIHGDRIYITPGP